jgi:hypothetical protein
MFELQVWPAQLVRNSGILQLTGSISSRQCSEVGPPLKQGVSEPTHDSLALEHEVAMEAKQYLVV